jgi:hypothetical protein
MSAEGSLFDFFDPNGPAMTPAERRRLLHSPQRPKKSGHAARPGSGPIGQMCGSCRHLARKHMAKTYLKCALMERHWTGGGGTDVRARDLACTRWEAKIAGEVLS